MKLTPRTQHIARVSNQKPIEQDPVAELRQGRAAFGQAAILFEAAALSVRSPKHARHLATLSRLTQEAARPIGRIIRELEAEAARWGLSEHTTQSNLRTAAGTGSGANHSQFVLGAKNPIEANL
jgi:hypothetical protein